MSVRLVIMLLAVLSVYVAFTTPQTPEPSVLKGFRKAEVNEVLRRGGRGMDSPSYCLSLVGDRLRVETFGEWSTRMGAEEKAAAKPKPPFIKVILSGSRGYWSPGQGVPVEDGWLEGFDIGEFGGGLYWFAKDASAHRKINARNTQIVAKTSKGIFALQSLSHLSFWYAALVEVRKGPKGWEARHVTDLHESPQDVIQAGGRFLYATDYYVSTLETDGRQREIYRSWSDMGVGSLVRRSNGEVWVGAAHGLLRLTPKANGEYAVQWFLPVGKPSRR